MLPGISTACFYPQNTDDALKQLCKAGVKSTEYFVNCAGEMASDFVREVRMMAEDAGVTILSVHPFTCGLEPMLFFSSYDRRFQEGMEFYRRYYEAANQLGAEIVVFHGGGRHIHTERAFYFERFGRLVEDAKKYGIYLCHENVSRCVGYTPDFFCDLKKAIPDAWFVFDTKQAHRSGENIYNFAQIMGDRVRHVHISDHNGPQECLPPGKGVLNIAKLLTILAQNGFDGGVQVELYRENFVDFVEIFASYQHLSAICRDISTTDKTH